MFYSKDKFKSSNGDLTLFFFCGVIDRYQPSCMNIFKLPAKFASAVLDSETSLSVLKNDLNMTLTYCDVHKVSLLDIYTRVPKDIVLRMAGQIKEGLNYISRLLDNIDKFPIESKKIFCNILLGDGTNDEPTLLQEEKMQLQELKARVVGLKDQFTQERDTQPSQISDGVDPNLSKPNEERGFNKK